MADIDEDAPVTSLHAQSQEDHDPNDETQDFRFLTSLTSKSGGSGPILKRGEKDFEPHGTKHQDGVLAASRQAMHNALDHTRIHHTKNHIRAFYYGEGSLERDIVVSEELRQGLDDDHVVIVENPKGPHFRTMGKSTTKVKRSTLWLFPEEALYLVERGNLDLWWPSESSFTGIRIGSEYHGNAVGAWLKDEGVPMSLQAAYAMLLGEDGEKGKISIERYAVYANLKRAGYVVTRASEQQSSTASGREQDYQVTPTIPYSPKSESLFAWLFGRYFAKEDPPRSPYSPLVRPGMYRSYNAIYHQIALIPRNKPTPVPEHPAPELPFQVAFELWKPARIPTYAKSNPGEPDFRVAVVDARSSLVPSLDQMMTLLESTPWDPPPENMNGRMYQKLRHGWRNVVLAVNDQGIVSYLRLSETAFGEVKLYESFDRGKAINNKRGGGRGRGRGRAMRGQGTL